MKSIGLFLFSLVFLLTGSCSSSNLINPHQFSNGWKNGEVVQFDINVKDDTKNHDLFFILRHDKNYAFSNIFLITEIRFENDSISTDTLEYALSEKNGKWLGNKRLSIVEHTLPFKENLKLIKDSTYIVTVRNSMRLNNEISPIQNLEKVLDLGLLIESVK